MKLGNFASIDPGHPGGLPGRARDDEEVWAEFWSNPAELSATAIAIRAVGASQATDLAEAEEGEEGSPEGRLLYRLHRRRERNRGLVGKKKAAALATTGRIACEVCDFDFAVAYGSHGVGYIECHHRIPLAQLGQTKTRLSDLALVCSNCHSMLHFRRNLSLAELGATMP
jgi:5-methylcytosine-specific restriction protein A